MLSLDAIWLNNTLEEWGTALLLALSINLLVAVGKWFVSTRVSSQARRTVGGVDDALVAMAQQTKQLLIFGVTLLIGSQYLELAPRLDQALVKIATVSGFLQIGLWFSGGLGFWINRHRYNSMSVDVGATTSLAAVHFIGKLLLWALLLLLMLDNLGVNVTAMVAGLGVGGIAVALAVQNILGDLFASLSIVIDKPFVIGDVISVDSFTGTVELVGLKTTRLRSNTGEQIIISNGDLLKTRIRNFKRMQERRILFGFGVVYQISPEQLASIPELIEAVVKTVPKTRFERAHFKAFGASSLDFEVVFWMRDPDFMTGLDAQQAVNLGIFRRFEEEGIQFAHPAPAAAAVPVQKPV